MSDPADEQPAMQPFEQARQVGTVELDRYCAACGYNLRQQAIRRDAATKLLLCKCPECGAFEPANTLTTATRSWFRFIVVLVWLLWIVIWLKLIFWSAFGVTGLAVVSGDLRQSWVDFDNVNVNQLVENEALQRYLDELAQQQAQQSQQGNSPVAAQSYYYGNDVRDLGPMHDDVPFFLTLFLVAAAAIGAVMTTITVVAMPHWRRWGYVCFAISWPMIGVVIFHVLIWPELYSWRMVTIELRDWHMKSALGIEAIAIAGGLAAVWLGRPIARGIIRLIVPPKRRGVFAYLWLADSKTPPKTV